MQKITYFGQVAFVSCDRKCHKAWGVNSRPRHMLDKSNPDDFVFLSDSFLGTAPENPGTYEGCDGKPGNFHKGPLNKWCVRECERSALFEKEDELKIPDMENPLPNIR